MTIKRTQFLSKLLRISEINQQLIEVNEKSTKQPAYAKKIKLTQISPTFNIQDTRGIHTQQSSSRIIVINKPNLNYNIISSYRSQTLFQEDEICKKGYSASKIYEQHLKSIIDRKRTSLNIEFKGNNKQQQNLSNSITCQGRYLPNNSEDIYRRRLNYKDTSNLQRRNYSQKKRQQSIKFINSKSIKQSNFLQAKSIQSIQNKKQFQLQIKKQKEIKNFKSLNQPNYYNQKQLTAFQIQEQKKKKLSMIKQINKNYAKPFLPPPKITAKSYIICQIKNDDNLKVIVSFNSKNTQEVASLTKIMTCIVTIQFCQINSIDLNIQQIKIGKYQSVIGGTSAELQQGQVYTIMQLLYGMMLPSGNDASMALAVWCGKRLILLDRMLNGLENNNELNNYGEKLLKSQCYARFIKQMNYKAQSLKMLKTCYANSHGLINVNNKSTAYDIALLSAYAMKNSIFRQIVSSKSYTCTIKHFICQEKLQDPKIETSDVTHTQPDIQEETQSKQWKYNPEKSSRPATAKIQSTSQSTIETSNSKKIFKQNLINVTIQWQNTHKLLLTKPKEYIGIKTGITTNAGPCLSSCIVIDGRKFLIVVLSCAKINLRFKQTEILKKWVYKHQGLVRTIKKPTNLILSSSIKSIDGQKQQKDEDQFDGED